MNGQQRRKTEQEKRESGVPGGGAGRKAEVGRSGIYPMSGLNPSGDAEIRGMATWGQSERGAAGYEDHGSSELSYEGAQVLGAFDPYSSAEQSLPVQIVAGDAVLQGDLRVPTDAHGIVLFAHGSGSSRHSPRNQHVAAILQQAGIATLLLDLLTADEEEIDLRTAELRFDIELLANRLLHASHWVGQQRYLADFAIGYFGASTGAAAALIAASKAPEKIAAVVSRGGRPDLAGPVLGTIRAPTLLVVGGEDHTVLELNRKAMSYLQCESRLEIVAGATHLFEEPGALDQVAQLAREWFEKYLRRSEKGNQAA